MTQSNILDRMKDDFKVFLTLVWHELGLPKPTRAQLAIADYLQHGPKRLQIQAFRGIGTLGSCSLGGFDVSQFFNATTRAYREGALNQAVFSEN